MEIHQRGNKKAAKGKSEKSVTDIELKTDITIHRIGGIRKSIQRDRDKRMNDDTTLTRIEKELNRLVQGNWINVIRLLDDHYQGYPLEDESQIPSEAIYPILQSLDVDDSPEERFIHRVHQLDCFSYRACYWDEDKEAVYWNPLNESFQEFEGRAINRTVHYQVDIEHPAKDIIRMWLVTRIKQ